ncbi:MAG TPA: glycosyltransferase family 2 protein [Terriglobia bacterium]|nr:glycosyltransferase family 2 protein [Terriglobia bacterium]
MQIAVLIPCHNEAAAIGSVVQNFRAALPHAAIYVYDNNSTDRTAEVAAAAGAIVRRETRQGKGHVVCRMFADVDADVYVLVDGDDTYDASAAPRMVERLCAEQLDMVTGVRVPQSRGAYRPGHVFGNRLLTSLVSNLFASRFTDLLSGYRVFSRRFVKSFPALVAGFEIETAFTVHAVELRMPIAETETSYKDRPAGSASKLHTFRDGFRILRTILRLVLEVKPLSLLGGISFLFAVAAVAISIPVLATYAETGLVPRLPTALLSASMMVLAFLLFVSGLILEMVTLGRRESKRLRYLALPAPPPLG